MFRNNARSFKHSTEAFFDEYNNKHETGAYTNLDRFLTRHYYFDISKFLLSFVSSNINDSIKILDIGCGGGNYLIFLAEKLKKGKYYGVDISQSAVNQAKENIKKDSFTFFADPFLSNFQYHIDPTNIEFSKINGLDLPFNEGVFNVVYFVMVLHHTYKYDDLIQQAARTLKRGGIMIIVDLRGYGRFTGFIIKTIVKLVPFSILKKVFNNDLILENRDIPLRSDVSLKKIKRIIEKNNLNIIENSTYYFLANYFILALKMLDSGLKHKTSLSLLKFIIFIDRRLARKFKNSASCFTFVAKKHE